MGPVEAALYLSPVIAVCCTLLAVAVALRQAGRRCADSSSGSNTKKGETPATSSTAQLTARPQVLRNDGSSQKVWPDHWGIQISQVRQFLTECQADADWSPEFSMYDLVERYVKPRTLGSGIGLALLLNREAPLEVSVMISHAWAENAVEFVRALELSVKRTDVMFICALSLYQNEDGEGPSIADQLGSHASESPFYRVLMHIQDTGCRFGVLWRWRTHLRRLPVLLSLMAITWLYLPMVSSGCIPAYSEEEGLLCYQSMVTTADEHMLSLGALQGAWAPVSYALLTKQPEVSLWVQQDVCFVFALVCAGAALVVSSVLRLTVPYRGRMLVVPNRQCDLYTRLWCVYEIFTARNLHVPIELAHSLADAGTCSSREAACGSDRDMQRIRGEIEDLGESAHQDAVSGYVEVDLAIGRTRRQARNRSLAGGLAQAWPSMLSMVGVVRILIVVPDDYRGYWMLQVAGSFLLGDSLAAVVLYKLMKHRQGCPTCRDLLILDALFFCAGFGMLASVMSIAGWNGDAEKKYLSWMWLLMLGAFYTAISFAILLLLFLQLFARCLPHRRDGGVKLSASFVLVEPLLHYVIVPLCVFGSVGLKGPATTTFYVVSFMSVCVGFPSCLMAAALAWDVRLK